VNEYEIPDGIILLLLDVDFVGLEASLSSLDSVELKCEVAASLSLSLTGRSSRN